MEHASGWMTVRRTNRQELSSTGPARPELPPFLVAVEQGFPDQGFDEADARDLEEAEGQELILALAEEEEVAGAVGILESARVDHLAGMERYGLERPVRRVDAGDDRAVVGDRVDHAGKAAAPKPPSNTQAGQVEHDHTPQDARGKPQRQGECPGVDPVMADEAEHGGQ